MGEVLSLFVGMLAGVLVCAVLIGAIAWIWRRQWWRALVYFGLADDEYEPAADEPSMRARRLAPRMREEAFEWPRARRESARPRG